MTGASGADPEPSGQVAAAHGFGAILDTSARSIIADAGKALTDPELSDAERVHEVRKALKRWRAWLRLLSGPKTDQAFRDDAVRMRAEARELMQTLSGARDAQAALDALADLGKPAIKAPPPISTASLATIHKRLTVLRDAAEQTGFTSAVRERLMRYLQAATATIDSWPLADIAFGTVADGITATYRRARQLIPDDWDEADPEQLHELRRRVVEHRHHMELIEPLWPRFGQVWGEETQRLRNRLGACQDLAMLSNFTAPHQPLAPWRAKLNPAIAARRSAHVITAERLAGRLFSEKPKAFRKRIVALWNAKRASQKS